MMSDATTGPRPAAVLTLLLGIALLLYANTVQNQFVFDDELTFRRNPAIRGLDRLPELLGSRTRGYRPVRYLSFAVDHAISGDDPWAYHVSNALYHGVTAGLVFLVLRRLAGGDGRVALAGALIFVCHPVHTESVAYISGRRDLLTTLFFLLALLAYLRHREDGRTRWLALSLGSFGLALGSKEMAVTLPAIVALHDLLLDREAFRRRLPLYAAGLAVAAAAAIWAVTSGASNQKGWHGGSAAANFLTVARIHAHYLSLLAFPRTLLADYSAQAFPASRSLLDPPATLAAVAALAALSGLAVLWRRGAPLVAFGIAWFLVTLLPVSHIVPFHEIAAEHYLYLPSVGFCLIAGLGVERLRAAAGARVAYALLAVVLVALSARTIIRNRDWRDSETLWAKTVETAPRCARARFNLGVIRAGQGRLDAALVHLREAVAIQPTHVVARFKTAQVLGRIGRVADARAELEETLRIAKTLDPSPLAPGDVSMALGRHVEAVGLYEAELRRRPTHVHSLLGIGFCHEFLGNETSALRAYERALAVDPTNVKALRRAAFLSRRSGQAGRAAELEERARRSEERDGGTEASP